MFKIIRLSFLLICFYCTYTICQEELPDKIISLSTLRSERINFKAELMNEIIKQNLELKLNKETESNWQSAFWGMELGLVAEDNILTRIKKEITDLSNHSDNFIRSFLEMIYTLYPRQFNELVSGFLYNTNNPKLFAMCVNYLINSKAVEIYRSFFVKLMKKKFPDWETNPILTCLKYQLESENIKVHLPPIQDLFSNKYEKNAIIIFSIQRKDRNYPGICIIRKPNGKFLRNDDGNIFSVPQLARSITNLPGYLTNGNTPQGIFSLQGFGISKNQFIGPTENIQMILPFEYSASLFFHDSINSPFTKEMYSSLLPINWKNYFPIYEAFYAGKAGRNEIIVHGTTIDPWFYIGQPYYPNTPSLGCLCSYEEWNETNGERILSYQQKLIDALKQITNHDLNGYLVVVEINDKKSPVSLDELEELIIQAEKSY
jgi:hypothetical protein